MEQLSIFEPSHTTNHKTGFRYRRHIRKDGRHVALMIPHESEAFILPGKYQDVIPYDSFELDYEQYAEWLNENNFEEREATLCTTKQNATDTVPVA